MTTDTKPIRRAGKNLIHGLKIALAKTAKKPIIKLSNKLGHACL